MKYEDLKEYMQANSAGVLPGDRVYVMPSKAYGVVASVLGNTAHVIIGEQEIELDRRLLVRMPAHKES